MLKDCTDVTDGLEPEIREIFSSALLISEKCSEICKFGSGKGFAAKSGSFELLYGKNFTNALAHERDIFHVSSSLILSSVRKLAIRLPQSSVKFSHWGGKPNSKFLPNSPHQLGNRGLTCGKPLMG